MNNIPPDMYERVQELSLAIVNASDAGDDVLVKSLKGQLREYYDEQVRLGLSHPFLTEAMADYTDAPSEAVGLYELALVQSRGFPDEPTHTKMIPLAELLIRLGQTELAKAYLRYGRNEAVLRNDTFWIQEADTLLHELQS